MRGHLLFDHAREPANFVASRGKTTGLSEPGYNGGRVEGVPTGLSEPGYNGGRMEGVPTGRSERGDNGGRMEGVPSGLSEPGYNGAAAWRVSRPGAVSPARSVQ